MYALFAYILEGSKLALYYCTAHTIYWTDRTLLCCTVYAVLFFNCIRRRKHIRTWCNKSYLTECSFHNIEQEKKKYIELGSASRHCTTGVRYTLATNVFNYVHRPGLWYCSARNVRKARSLSFSLFLILFLPILSSLTPSLEHNLTLKSELIGNERLIYFKREKLLLLFKRETPTST
jgi:hypothetical protein